MRRRFCFACFVAGLMFPLHAQAAIIEMPACTAGPNSLFSGTIPCPKFDAALGTLTGVSFDQFEVLSANVDLRNHTTSTRTANVHFYGWLEFQIPGINAQGDEPFGMGRRHFDRTGSISIPPQQVRNLHLDDITLQPFTSQPGGSFLPSYIGPGTFSFTYRYVAGHDVTPTGVFDNALNLTSSVTGTVRYEYTPTPLTPGDANGDGHVNRIDAVVVAANYGKSAGALRAHGDFNADGAVTLADLAILQENLDSPFGAASAAVPEPSGFILALLGVAALLLRSSPSERTRPALPQTLVPAPPPLRPVSVA